MASQPRVLFGTTGESWDSMARAGPFATASDCEELVEGIGRDLVRARRSARHRVRDGRFPRSPREPQVLDGTTGMVTVVDRGPGRLGDGPPTIDDLPKEPRITLISGLNPLP
jgi:hypothetical protein